MGVRDYLSYAVIVLALVDWLVFKALMRRYKKFERVSPLVELMDATTRKRYRLYAKFAAGHFYFMAALWVLTAWGYGWAVPIVAGIAAAVGFMIYRMLYARYTAFLLIHEAFDGDECSPIALAAALALYYQSVGGTGKVVLSLSRSGPVDNLLLTRGAKSFVLKPQGGMPPWVLAMVATTIAQPINVYGLLIEHIGGRPTIEILTDPTHTEIP
jgi:hypothetical protein